MVKITEAQKTIMTDMIIDMSLVIKSIKDKNSDIVSKYVNKHQYQKDSWWIEFDANVVYMFDNIMDEIYEVWTDIDTGKLEELDDIEQYLYDILGMIIDDRQIFTKSGFVYDGFNSLYKLIINALNDLRD